MGNSQGMLSLRNPFRREDRHRLLKSTDEDDSSIEDFPVENTPSENLAESSEVEKEVSVANLVDVSDVVENTLTKTLAKDLYDMNKMSLDSIIKISDFLKNLSLEDMSLKTLVNLLTAEKDVPSGNAGTSGEIFRLRVLVPDCYFSLNMGLKCSGKLKFHECYACVHGYESTTCLIHIANYNNQRKKVLECTILDSKFTKGMMKYIIYLWDSKQETWRLVTSGCDKIDQDKCFPEAEVWAETINYSQNSKETVKFLSQSTLCNNLPTHIAESLAGETHITTYNFQLEKVIDVSLVRGRKYERRTEFYIECRGLRNFGYSFTARNDDQPYGE